MPKAPSFSAPSAPSFSPPPSFSSPKFDAPAPPKLTFDIPKEKSPSASSLKPELLVPQETRDANARNANDKFKALDADAKEAEKAARAARDVANKQKKVKNQLKDLACETRPGGKLLCLRGFGTGF